MKNFALIGLVALCASALTAQSFNTHEKVRLAVTKIANVGTSFTDDQMKQLTDWLASELTDHFRVITRENVAMMLQQQADAQSLGCDQTSCMADIAKSVNADLSLAGSLSRHGDKFILNLRLVKPDASVAAAMDEEIPAMHLNFGIDQAKPLMKFTAQRLWRIYTGDEKIAALPSYKFVVEPERASVYLAGQRICESTPCFWQPKIKGEYQFTITARGFHNGALSVTAEAGAESSIEKTIRLEPLPQEERPSYAEKSGSSGKSDEISVARIQWGTLFFLTGIGAWINSAIYNGKYQTSVDTYQHLGANDSLATYNNTWAAVELNYKVTIYSAIGAAASITLAFIIWLWPTAKPVRYLRPIIDGFGVGRSTNGTTFENIYDWRYNYAF